MGMGNHAGGVVITAPQRHGVTTRPVQVRHNGRTVQLGTRRGGHASLIVRVKFSSRKMRDQWDYACRLAVGVNREPAEFVTGTDGVEHVSHWHVWGDAHAVLTLLGSSAVVRRPAGYPELFPPDDDGTVPDCWEAYAAPVYRGCGSTERTCDHAPVRGKAKDTVRYATLPAIAKAVADETATDPDTRKAVREGTYTDVYDVSEIEWSE